MSASPQNAQTASGGRPALAGVALATRPVLATGNCTNCGLSISPGNAYCPECGAPLPTEQSPILAAARRAVPAEPITDQSPERVHTPLDDRAVSAPVGDDQEAAISIDTASTSRRYVFDSDAATSSGGPRLLVIGQDGTTLSVHPLVERQIDIGRTEGDLQIPDDRFMCPRHARIIREGGRTLVQDLGSINGVYKRVHDPVRLDHGDYFLVGLVVLKFELLAESEQHLRGAVDRGTQVFGSPPSPRYARLSEQTMEGISRSIFIATREETILGREVGDIVFSSDPFMSRRHAAISRNNSDGTFRLLDLGSSNGTFLRIRGQSEVVSGDYVRIGLHLFRFDLSSEQVTSQGQAQAR